MREKLGKLLKKRGTNGGGLENESKRRDENEKTKVQGGEGVKKQLAFSGTLPYNSVIFCNVAQ